MLWKVLNDRSFTHDLSDMRDVFGHNCLYWNGPRLSYICISQVGILLPPGGSGAAPMAQQCLLKRSEAGKEP